MSLLINWILSYFVIQGIIICFIDGVKESVRTTDRKENCMTEIMSTKYLPDDRFTASSSVKQFIHRPSTARITNIFYQGSPSDGSAWCPSSPADKEIKEWIQVEFNRMTILKTIFTMGRGEGNYKKFTPEILIKYQRSYKGPWFTYRSKQNETILKINTDARNRLRSFLQTVVAKRIKIYPVATITGPVYVCLKFAFLGCFMEDEIMSYSVPQGDSVFIKNVSVDLRDNVYDGQISSILQNGLGLLTDNYAWKKKFDMEKVINDNFISMFTGWLCGPQKNHSFININFYFEEERNFSTLILYSVKDSKHNIRITGPIIVSIGRNNKFTHIVWNASDFEKNHPDLNEFQINISLNYLQGNICIVNITCVSNNLILLSEIEIKSVAAKSIRNDISNPPNQSPTIRYFNVTDKHTTSLFPDYQSTVFIWKQQDITVIAMIILITLLLIFVAGMGIMCFKFQRSRRNKLTKKLELVAQCNNQSMCGHSLGNVFTIQSKTPTAVTNQQKYFTDCKMSHSVTYNGSQQSDGIYASWPNTDEDPDVPIVDKEEEKCLLNTEIAERSSSKEYATYQCGINPSGINEYLLNDFSVFKPQSKTRPSSIATNLPNLSTLSVPLLKIVTSYDTQKSTPIITYRSTKRLVPSTLETISYHHLLNYRGPCGDVDFRYQPSYPRVEQTNLESNIKVIPISSLIPIHPLIKGEFGAICVCNVLTDTDSQTGNCFYVKHIKPDSKTVTKANFIMNLKILSSITCVNVAQLEAIAIDSDLISGDLMSVIKSARFCILMEYLNGYNLKDFLCNIYYSKASQEFKSTPSFPHSQISSSSLLIIITQIASGMKYFEDLGLTHRDLACRNCIIDMKMHVKIYPGGLLTTKFNDDYCSIELINQLVTFPLRWMAPESITGGLFTIKSDVWSFAVTLWEIFTLCSLIPYGSLTNEALIDLMSHKNNTPRLPCPQSCPKEIFDIMSQCWNWDDSLRPKFIDILKFLQIKTNFMCQAQFILPAPPSDDKKS